MKNKYLLPLASIAMLLLSCSKEAIKTPKEVEINVEEISTSVSIHTVNQKALLNALNPASFIEDNVESFGDESNSFPLPISFSWEETNDINQKATNYVLSISENNDLSNSLTYIVKGNNFDVYNLKLNTTYYYAVSSNHHGAYFDSDISTFIINDDYPRNIFVEGVENVRDCGGWNVDGEYNYRQGMLYRTAQFNYDDLNNTYKSAPTEEGKRVLLNDLQIRTEIDLRRTTDFDGFNEVGGIESSPLGESVNYVSCPMYYGGNNIFNLEENLPSIKLFFETLAEPTNYPIAFHCLRGTDRTGALAYVIGAMMGMSEEDLMLDYLFSDLAKIGNPVLASTISNNNFYVQGIANSEGENISEKAKNYVMSKVDVSLDTLNSIIQILSE